MQSKKCLFSKGLIYSDIKRFWWVSALYSLGLFFTLPMLHITRIMNELAIGEQWTRDMLKNTLLLSGSNTEFQILLLIIVPVALAVLLYRYMQVNKSVAMAHVLPYKRETLFLSHALSGIILLTIPVLFIGLVMIILRGLTDLKECYLILNIMQWIGRTLLFDYLFFVITIFVGMFTGSSIAHFVFTYIFQVLPIGIYVLGDYSLRELVHGYGGIYSYDTFIRAMPISQLLDNNLRKFTVGHVLGYIFATIIFFVIAIYLYNKRPLETADEIVAFSVMKPVFKYGVTFCCMLVGGSYMGEIADRSLGMLILGYLFGSFMGYWIAEMLLQKSLKVWNAYKGYLIYICAILVVLAGISIDIFGYVRYIPKQDDIQNVYLGYSINDWMNIKNQKSMRNRDTNYNTLNYFEEKGNIENIVQLHRFLTEDQNYQKGSQRYIIYTLKNGKSVIRSYRVDEKHHAPFLKPIYESVEYKRSRFPILTQKQEDIKWIEIADDRTGKKPVVLADSMEISKFTELLREELLKASFEDLSERSHDFVRIHIADVQDESSHTYYSLRKSYTSLIKWLQDAGYYDQVMLLPEDIEYVVLEKAEVGPTSRPDSNKKRVEIRDSLVIEKLLNNYNSYIYDRVNEKTIIIGFYSRFHGRYFQTYIYENEAIPEEIKPYLEKLEIGD